MFNQISEAIPNTLIAGLVGSIVYILLETHKNIWKSAAYLFVGFGTSVYLAPVISLYLEVENDRLSNGVGFLTGAIGALLAQSFISLGKKVLRDPTSVATNPLIMNILENFINRNKKKNVDDER